MSDLSPHAISAVWTRVQMEKSRLLARGDKLCDLFRDAVPTDRHHIYTKYSTMSNEYARELADSEELSALLCRALIFFGVLGMKVVGFCTQNLTAP